MENKVCSFQFQLNPTSTTGNPRSFPNILFGTNPIICNIPENKNVLIKNIRCNAWIPNETINNNSLSNSGAGSPPFTVRFLMMSNKSFYRQTRGQIIYPNGIPALVVASGQDTIEYILNADSPQLENLNLVGDGVFITQLGFAVHNYVIDTPFFIIMTIEYQDILIC